MDVTDYTKAVRRKVGLLETDTAALPDDVVLSALNEGLKAIAADWEWHWLFATETGAVTAGDNTIPTPEGYLRTITLRTSGGPALSEQAYSSLVDAENYEGAPSAFALGGDNFYLWPMPDVDEPYEHVYYRSEPELVNPTDAPMLPDAYSPWLVAEAAMRLPLRTNSAEKYTMLVAEVNDWRKRAKDEARRNVNAQPRRIRRTRQSIWSDV